MRAACRSATRQSWSIRSLLFSLSIVPILATAFITVSSIRLIR